MSVDLRTDPHEYALLHAERALSVRLDRASVVYGTSGATAGFRTHGGTWVRLERRNRWREPDQAWVGLEAAAAIRGVKRPEWYQSATWTDSTREVVWRADEVEFIDALMVGDVETAATLPASWWTGMRESLSALGEHPTKRFGMSQEHLAKRITEVFGEKVDTTVDEWATAHTDLHWSNLSTEGHIIDFEDWGMAPRGLEAATLWQSSLNHPELAEKVRREFAADLETGSGKLSMLVQCANAIRAADRLGSETPLSAPARAAADVLLAELRS